MPIHARAPAAGKSSTTYRQVHGQQRLLSRALCYLPACPCPRPLLVALSPALSGPFLNHVPPCCRPPSTMATTGLLLHWASPLVCRRAPNSPNHSIPLSTHTLHSLSLHSPTTGPSWRPPIVPLFHYSIQPASRPDQTSNTNSLPDPTSQPSKCRS
jgi:hypothetical protein